MSAPLAAKLGIDTSAVLDIMPRDLADRVAKVHRDIALLQGEREEVERLLAALQAAAKQQEKCIVRRQIAHNIEHELKLDLLNAVRQVCASSTDHLVYEDGSDKGQWVEWEVFELCLDDAARLAYTFAPDAADKVFASWFGIGSDGRARRELFNRAMSRLKEASTASPSTTLGGIPVDVDMAKQLVDGAFPCSVSRPRQREIATEFVCKLHARRQLANNSQLLHLWEG